MWQFKSHFGISILLHFFCCLFLLVNMPLPKTGFHKVEEWKSEQGNGKLQTHWIFTLEQEAAKQCKDFLFSFSVF